MKLHEKFGRIKKPFEHPEPQKLSVCMIVKNERADILSAVQSFQGFADEIIINDTGSTDGTVELLRGLDVILTENKWEDDFSKARNQSLALAQYGWILWMDADDRVPPDQVENFNKLKTAPLDRMFGFEIINIKDKLPIGNRFLQHRMFPNTPEIYFQRIIHEVITYTAAETGIHMVQTIAKIHHTGYDFTDENKRKEKGKRNERLLLKEPSLRDTPTLQTSLADAYIMQGRHSEAGKVLIELNKREDLKTEHYDCYTVLPSRIGDCYLSQNKPIDALQWYEVGIERDPGIIEQMFHKAASLKVLSRLSESVDCYYTVLSMPKRLSSYAGSYDNARIFTYCALDKILAELKREPERILMATQMKKEYPKIRVKDADN